MKYNTLFRIKCDEDQTFMLRFFFKRTGISVDTKDGNNRAIYVKQRASVLRRWLCVLDSLFIVHQIVCGNSVFVPCFVSHS